MTRMDWMVREARYRIIANQVARAAAEDEGRTGGRADEMRARVERCRQKANECARMVGA